jgi:hypothetical protein
MNSRADYWKERSARRRRLPGYAEKQRDWYRSWRERNPMTDEQRARKAAQMREYAQAHETRQHHKARRAVRTAIASGRLVRIPCESCGCEPTQAHHDDYSKPLDVRWLCPPCHRVHHAKATK